MEKVMIDTTEYQQRVLECIGSEKVDKLFGSTMFVNLPESSMCKQAMIHGMAIASMMTSQCNQVIVEKRPIGHVNQKVKSRFCPNCGAKMDGWR